MGKVIDFYGYVERIRNMWILKRTGHICAWEVIDPDQNECLSGCGNIFILGKESDHRNMIGRKCHICKGDIVYMADSPED